jgi:hypothetical protein
LSANGALVLLPTSADRERGMRVVQLGFQIDLNAYEPGSSNWRAAMLEGLIRAYRHLAGLGPRAHGHPARPFRNSTLEVMAEFKPGVREPHKIHVVFAPDSHVATWGIVSRALYALEVTNVEAIDFQIPQPGTQFIATLA